MRTTLRPAAVVLVLIVGVTIEISGGAIKQHISDIFPKMIQELPFNGQTPLAREARFTWYSRIYLNDKPQPATFATNEPGSAKAKVLVPAVIPTVGSGVEMSKAYERKRDDARSDGNRVMELHYTRMSETALQSEIATGRLDARLGLIQASLNAISAVGAGLRYSFGERLMKWTAATTGAVDPSAPPGSTLHLGFFMFTHSSRFAIESRIELIVTAALETAGTKELIQSARAIELNTYKDSNPAAAAPAAGFVVFDNQLFEGKAPNVKTVNSTPFGRQYAVLANSAVADLYNRIEETKQQGALK